MGTKKWLTLEHNGVLFPPAYVPHEVKMLYDGNLVGMNAAAEEVATMYAVMLETDFVSNPTFNKNFFRDWKKLLGADTVIEELSKCDFRPIKRHCEKVKEEKKEERKLPTMRKQLKEEAETMNGLYAHALIDGYQVSYVMSHCSLCRFASRTHTRTRSTTHGLTFCRSFFALTRLQQEKISNYRVEPPGLFRGRGDHPKTGTLKKRVMPEDITINIGRDTTVPKCPIDGRNWKGIVHNDESTWLAYWNDNVNNDFKYVYLAPSSQFKGISDMNKYAKAQTLKEKIGYIRGEYVREMENKQMMVRQRATAIYLIDYLALRVGNEKNTDEVADTVGCCSLRVEHLRFVPVEEIDGKKVHKVHFNFLGKDSMVYDSTATLSALGYHNLKSFCDGKAPKKEVFDLVDSGLMNDHLKTMMPGLSAKVFRTYNASVTLEKELVEGAIGVDSTDNEKILFYNQVRMLNHDSFASVSHYCWPSLPLLPISTHSLFLSSCFT
jgi:DNA topoisomerase-1